MFLYHVFFVTQFYIRHFEYKFCDIWSSTSVLCYLNFLPKTFYGISVIVETALMRFVFLTRSPQLW